MKYLKMFEGVSKVYEFVEVDFTGGGDGAYALYIDGILFKEGDYYHNKIEIWIKSFIEGVKWAGISIDYKKIKITDEALIEEVSEIGNLVPKTLKELEGKY